MQQTVEFILLILASISGFYIGWKIADFKIDFVEIADGDGFSTGRYQEFLLLS